MKIGGSRGLVTGLQPRPPFQISKIKEDNTSWKWRREKELQVCLVFTCTRVDICINTHFSFKIFLLNPPPFEKFLDPRLFHDSAYCKVHYFSMRSIMIHPLEVFFLTKKFLWLHESMTYTWWSASSGQLNHCGGKKRSIRHNNNNITTTRNNINVPQYKKQTNYLYSQTV